MIYNPQKHDNAINLATFGDITVLKRKAHSSLYVPFFGRSPPNHPQSTERDYLRGIE